MGSRAIVHNRPVLAPAKPFMSRISTRFFLGLCMVCAFALVLSALLAAHASAQAPSSNPVLARDAPFTVAVNTSTIEASPVFVAHEQRDAMFRLINGGVRDVGSGAAHAGTNAETQMLLARMTSPNIRMLFTVAEGLYRVVARRSAGIARLADLRGKKIITPANTSAHYHLVRMLATVGVDESAVTLVSVPTAEMAAAVRDGRADALSMWEPEAQRLVDMLGRDAIVFQDNGVYRELFSLYTSTEVLNDASRRAQLVTFVRGLLTATDTVRRKPPTLVPLVAKIIKQPEPLVDASWKHHRFPAALPSDMLDVLVREEQWMAGHQKRTALGRAELSAFIDTSVLEEAKRGR
jgi:sulfonate transport system substrate-binding protein